MKIQRLNNIAVYSLTLWVISISSAHAYLDPGTGSLLLQGLLGGIAGAAVFVKLYWYKLTSWFGGDKSSKKENDE